MSQATDEGKAQSEECSLDDYTRFFLYKVNDLNVEPQDFETLGEFCHAAFYSGHAALIAWMAACMPAEDLGFPISRKMYNVIQGYRGLPGLPEPTGSMLEAFHAMLPLLELLLDRRGSDLKVRRILQELDLYDCGILPPGNWKDRTSHRAAFAFAQSVLYEIWFTVVGVAGVADAQKRTTVPRIDPGAIRPHHWPHLRRRLLKFRKVDAMQLFEYINLELARGFNNRIQLRPSRAEIKTKILFLAADPAGVPTKPLRLDREARLIKETIRSSKNQQRVDLETCWDVHSEDLSREMINHAPSIVHFGMHGGFGKVALSSHNRVEHLVTAEALLSLFKVFNGRTKLVVLSVCKSRSLAEDLANYVDCVIGMDGEIRDDSALIYSRGFYRGIAAGHSVQHAHELGKAELQIDNRPDADLPALACRRGVDPSTCCLLPN